MREFIPGTQARRDRLLDIILDKEVGDKDGLALIEWEDRSVTMEPVEWDSDNSAIVDDRGNRFFARGLGSDPKDFGGVPIWYIYAGNAGIMSTEACLIADAERYQDRVYDVGAGEELPEDIVAEGVIDPNGKKAPADVWDLEKIDDELVETARAIQRGDLEAVTREDLDNLRAQARRADDGDGGNGGFLEQWTPDALRDLQGSDTADEEGDELAPDGGAVAQAGSDPVDVMSERSEAHNWPDPDESAAVYDLRPPDGFDGVAIDPRQPDNFDPNPVTRADAKGAMEWAQHAVSDGTDTWMYGFIVGLITFGAIWVLMTVVPWLLGQIGGSGSSAGDAITGFLPLLAGPGYGVRALVEKARRAVGSAGGDE